MHSFYQEVITGTKLKFSDRSYNTDPNPWETTSKIRKLPHKLTQIFISMHTCFSQKQRYEDSLLTHMFPQHDHRDI